MSEGLYSIVNFPCFRKKYGDVALAVEEGKNAQIDLPILNMNLSQFLDEYKKRDIYVIHTVQNKTKGNNHVNQYLK